MSVVKLSWVHVHCSSMVSSAITSSCTLHEATLLLSKSCLQPLVFFELLWCLSPEIRKLLYSKQLVPEISMVFSNKVASCMVSFSLL